MMMNNYNIPPQLMQLLRSGNPQQALLNMLQTNSRGNPLIENILQMTNVNNGAGLEQIARNLCKSKGIDADQMFNNIRDQLK